MDAPYTHPDTLFSLAGGFACEHLTEHGLLHPTFFIPTADGEGVADNSFIDLVVYKVQLPEPGQPAPAAH